MFSKKKKSESTFFSKKKKHTDSNESIASTGSAKTEEPLNEQLDQQIVAIAELNEQCYGLIRRIESNNTALKKELRAHCDALTAEKRADILRGIVALKNDTAGKLNLINQLLEQINEPHQDEIVRQVQVQIKKAIEVELNEVIKKFFIIQVRAQENKESQVKTLYRLIHPEANVQEIELNKTADLEKLLLEVVFDSKNSSANQARAYTKARHNEILKIEHGLAELALLFNATAALVSAQAEMIIQIQENVQAAKENVRDGRKELTYARSLQR